MISSLLTHAARHHANGEVVSRTHEDTIHRTTWGETERRSRRLVRVLQRLEIGEGDRVGTLAWNGYRHLEVYYAAPGMRAICHTINPRLHPDDIAYIINHAAGSRAVRRYQFCAAARTRSRRASTTRARRRDAERRRRRCRR